jgi:two-component system LytT family sensor kinase
MVVTGIACIGLVFLQSLTMLLVPGDKAMAQRFFSLKNLVSHLTNFIVLSVYYYLLVNIYYNLIVRKSGFRMYLLVTVSSVVCFLVTNLISLQFSSAEDKKKFTLAVFIFSFFITSLVMTGIGLLIAYFTSLRDEQKQRKILEKQKMELEVENSQANFNFLKAQINPHFLHNTLNFLYSKALPLSEELSEGILCLSDIMRYALSEGGKDEKALLKDEITHLDNVIRINQLRFSNNLNVQVEVKGEVGGAMIVPFVLITLVENAFKHGDIRSKEHPIVVRLEVRDKGLYFYCSNKKKIGFKEISTGIGLQNILKRLDIVYGKNYSYTVTDEAEFYTTELIINEL